MENRTFTSVHELGQFLVDENKELKSKLMAQDFALRTILGLMLRDGHIDKDEMGALVDGMADGCDAPARRDGWTEDRIKRFQETIRSYKLGTTSPSPTFTVLDGGKTD